MKRHFLVKIETHIKHVSWHSEDKRTSVWNIYYCSERVVWICIQLFLSFPRLLRLQVVKTETNIAYGATRKYETIQLCSFSCKTSVGSNENSASSVLTDTRCRDYNISALVII